MSLCVRHGLWASATGARGFVAVPIERAHTYPDFALPIGAGLVRRQHCKRAAIGASGRQRARPGSTDTAMPDRDVILVDTSVWAGYLRSGDRQLAGLLDTGMVVTHPFVIGELALGNLRQRESVMNALSGLPGSIVATDAEVLHLIDRHALFGRGIGYVDVHLLAAARLTGRAELWTNDKRLHAIAAELGLAFKRQRRGS